MDECNPLRNSVSISSKTAPGVVADTNRRSDFECIKKVFIKAIAAIKKGFSSCCRHLHGRVEHLKEILEDKIASWIAGSSTCKPEDFDKELSDDAKHLIHDAFDDIDPKNVLDYHSHIITMLEDKGWVNPKMLNSLQGKVYLKSALGPIEKK